MHSAYFSMNYFYEEYLPQNVYWWGKDIIYQLIHDDKESEYRANIVLLESNGYTVCEIRRLIDNHDSNMRKWIHRINEKGIDEIV